MPRRALLLSLLIAAALLGANRPAAAEKDADDAKALLEVLSTSASKDERLAAAAKLEELGPRIVDVLAEFLKRTRTSTVEQRRTLLRNIKASVPDKGGNFQSPGREKAAKVRADDKFDWLAELVVAAPQPGLGDTIADDAAIRALAASKQLDAAKVILDVAFAADTMVSRDECGRYLRKMSPYSVPALIMAAQSKKDRSKQRYSNYQLERVDRQEPARAIAAAADDEDLMVAIIDAYGASEHREAVPVIVTMLNTDAPRVREAARKTWLAYVTPPDPPAPPQKHLKMTGGVESTKKKPMYLNSLQLARIEIARLTDELFHETLDDDADDPALQAASKKIFAFYDSQRSERDAAEVAAGHAKAEGGDLPGAVAIFDRLVAAEPLRSDRGAMAPVYFQYAEALAADAKWADAAAMYSKAHGLAPDADNATDALAAHYFALGKAESEAGKDGSAAFRKAVELRPDYAEAKAAEKEAAAPIGPPANKQWMLYVAGAVALGAVGLLAMGLKRKPAR
jgi:tetratricopeptide (TPR) repeat protein